MVGSSASCLALHFERKAVPAEGAGGASDAQGTNRDMKQYQLSTDDLKMKLEMRQHKPLAAYRGDVNLVPNPATL